MDLNVFEWHVTARSVLTLGLVDLEEFMFSDRYHLAGSALTQVCPSVTGIMLWINSNCCRVSLLLLVQSEGDFMKVTVMYFKVDSTILGGFQCSTCSAGAPLTYTQVGVVSFLGVEGPFLDKVGPSRVACRHCCLVGSVEAFSHHLKCFFKLLVWLMVLLQWCCFSAALLEKTLVYLLHLWLVLTIKHLLINQDKHGFKLHVD